MSMRFARVKSYNSSVYASRGIRNGTGIESISTRPSQTTREDPSNIILGSNGARASSATPRDSEFVVDDERRDCGAEGSLPSTRLFDLIGVKPDSPGNRTDKFPPRTSDFSTLDSNGSVVMSQAFSDTNSDSSNPADGCAKYFSSARTSIGL